MTNLHRLTMTTALVLGLGAAPAFADCHGDWDTNQDAMLDPSEFNTAYGQHGWFGEADADEDGFLSEDEFNSAFFRTYDADQDGRVTQEEHQGRFSPSNYYPGWQEGSDGGLSQDEYNASFRDGGSFAIWDTDSDGMLTQDEFSVGVYDTYDADTSGNLEESEALASCADFGEEGFWNF